MVLVKTCPALVIPFFGMALCKNADLNMTIDYSPRNETFIKNYSTDVQMFTENFSIDTECEFSCAYGFFLIGSAKRHCLPLSKWDGLQTTCKREGETFSVNFINVKFLFQKFSAKRCRKFHSARTTLTNVSSRSRLTEQIAQFHATKDLK